MQAVGLHLLCLASLVLILCSYETSGLPPLKAKPKPFPSGEHLRPFLGRPPGRVGGIGGQAYYGLTGFQRMKNTPAEDSLPINIDNYEGTSEIDYCLNKMLKQPLDLPLNNFNIYNIYLLPENFKFLFIICGEYRDP